MRTAAPLRCTSVTKDPRSRHATPPSLRKRLFSDSANRCAFPDCGYAEKASTGVPIVEVAHIHTLAPGGPRFDPQLTAAQVNDISNFIIVCPFHHALIDSSPSKFTAETLIGIRNAHMERVRRSVAASGGRTPTLPVDRAGLTETLQRLQDLSEQIGHLIEKVPALGEKPPSRLARASRLVQALDIWQSQRGNHSEEFWQVTFCERPELLGSATFGRPFSLKRKCYVGRAPA